MESESGLAPGLDPAPPRVERARCQAFTYGGAARCTNYEVIDGLCRVHRNSLSITKKPFIPTEAWHLYVMGGDDGPLKVGHSKNPPERLWQLRTEGGYRGNVTLPTILRDFRILVTRKEIPEVLTEKVVHNLLGDNDRIKRSEWWNRTENVLIRLAMAGLVFDSPPIAMRTIQTRSVP